MHTPRHFVSLVLSFYFPVCKASSVRTTLTLLSLPYLCQLWTIPNTVSLLPVPCLAFLCIPRCRSSSHSAPSQPLSPHSDNHDYSQQATPPSAPAAAVVAATMLLPSAARFRWVLWDISHCFPLLEAAPLVLTQRSTISLSPSQSGSRISPARIPPSRWTTRFQSSQRISSHSPALARSPQLLHCSHDSPCISLAKRCRIPAVSSFFSFSHYHQQHYYLPLPPAPTPLPLVYSAFPRSRHSRSTAPLRSPPHRAKRSRLLSSSPTSHRPNRLSATHSQTSPAVCATATEIFQSCCSACCLRGSPTHLS